MDPQAEGGQPESRGGAFAEGHSGGTPVANKVPALAKEAASYNAQIPKQVVPLGSSNGMSSGQFQQTMGGQFKVNNGASESTYATKKFYR